MSDKCKEKLVAVTGGWGFHQCYNKAKKDGWCMVHHPDSVAKRDKKATEVFEKHWENSPSERLRKANDHIKELEVAAQAVIDMYYATGNQIDPLIDILYGVLERGDD